MIAMLMNRMSFGGRYAIAALFYLGLGLIVISTSQAPAPALGSGGCDGENPCAQGYYCCQGECVPDDYVCCGDGTSGPSDTCSCCTGCTESCSEPSTLVCE
ncbi:MAG: hypothetical protein ACF8TS_03260 [Maioricimonas sp. JB049]